MQLLNRIKSPIFCMLENFYLEKCQRDKEQGSYACTDKEKFARITVSEKSEVQNIVYVLWMYVFYIYIYILYLSIYICRYILACVYMYTYAHVHGQTLKESLKNWKGSCFQGAETTLWFCLRPSFFLSILYRHDLGFQIQQDKLESKEPHLSRYTLTFPRTGEAPAQQHLPAVLSPFSSVEFLH